MKGKGMMVLAAVAGLVCAAALAAYVSAVHGQIEAARSEALARYGGEQAEVVVALRDLAPGETVDAGNTELRSWLVDLLPADAVLDASDVDGMELSSSVLAGEVLSKRRFGGESTAVIVPPGLQAVTVELERAQALGGAVAVGDRVDVYASGASGTPLVVELAQVLATGAGSSTRTWVTLAVAPDRVQELIASAQAGSLYLALPAS